MDIQGMITELREERACLDEALPADARTAHKSGKCRLKKLARPLIAGAADESISLFVHYDQMFHRGPPLGMSSRGPEPGSGLDRGFGPSSYERSS
jgi:hypothetical protein